MSDRLNCWQIKGCGREPGGKLAQRLGVCDAAAATDAHGLNGGVNGGRICWAISGTYGDGISLGSFAANRLSCLHCEVFGRVREEEEVARFSLLLPGQFLRACNCA